MDVWSESQEDERRGEALLCGSDRIGLLGLVGWLCINDDVCGVVVDDDAVADATESSGSGGRIAIVGPIVPIG